jgi:hypothetical protein
LPRDLNDVIHHFLPGEPNGSAKPERPAALPIIAIPIGERDVVRAAYAWNLAVELARRGASSTLLAPAGAEPSPLWPEPGRGPVGAEVVLTDAADFGALNLAALDIAVSRAADSSDGGVVLVSVPPAWFEDANDGRALIRWVLLFASTESQDLQDSYGLAKRIAHANPDARIGVTVHGVRRISEAQRAFDHIADVAHRRLAIPLTSYGLLVDDLHVYRAIASRRPIGLEHPQSRAARALRDVARLLMEDTRMPTDA